MQAKVKGTRSNKLWTIEAVETGKATSAHLKSRGFDGVNYKATRTLRDGRHACVLAFFDTRAKEFVCAY